MTQDRRPGLLSYTTRLRQHVASMALALMAASAAWPQGKAAGESWSASWASAQMAPYGTETLPAGAFNGATLREVVHLSTGGTRLRLTISNRFGTEPLVIHEVRAAHAVAAHPEAIDASDNRQVSFGGKSDITVPMGAEYISDPVELAVPALGDVAVSMNVTTAPSVPTLHAGAHATAVLVSGNHAADAKLDRGQRFTRWYFLSEVDVQQKNSAVGQGTVVAFGDSITDGHASTTDGNDRWPDDLARRLAAGAATAGVGVVNTGIGGNRVLEDGLGTDALARFGRDVLDVHGVRYAIVLEGINDLGVLDRTSEHSQEVHDALVAGIEAAFTQMVTRAHLRGIRVYGATLTPFAGSGYYHPGPKSEADRQHLNEWIRTSHVFDATIDFDAALRDPAQPSHMLAAYDSGDHLHPGPAGYKRMAEVIPLSLF